MDATQWMVYKVNHQHCLNANHDFALKRTRYRYLTAHSSSLLVLES